MNTFRRMNTRDRRAPCVDLLCLLLLLASIVPPAAGAPAYAPRGLCASVHARSPRNTYERALTGVWRSSDTTHGAAPGILTLRRDRKAVLAPATLGYIRPAPLEGGWSATANTLRIDIPGRGGADVVYSLNRRRHTLNLRYQNGMEQLFHRQVTASLARRVR